MKMKLQLLFLVSILNSHRLQACSPKPDDGYGGKDGGGYGDKDHDGYGGKEDGYGGGGYGGKEDGKGGGYEDNGFKKMMDQLFGYGGKDDGKDGGYGGKDGYAEKIGQGQES